MATQGGKRLTQYSLELYLHNLDVAGVNSETTTTRESTSVPVVTSIHDVQHLLDCTSNSYATRPSIETKKGSSICRRNF